VTTMDPAKTIFLDDRAEALPATYSIFGAAPLYNAGSQRPVYKATRTDTAEMFACTKISKSSLHKQDGMKALRQVRHQKYFAPSIGLISIVGGCLICCSSAGA